MIAKKVEVTRYYACDGKEFACADLCSAYEKSFQVKLERDIRYMQYEIRKLKEEKNQLRLQFSVAKFDAFEALCKGDKVGYHNKMTDYYKGKVSYQLAASNLKESYEVVNRLYNRAYEWFGTHKHKSNSARIERRQRSLRWRQENTPDKWRTSNTRGENR